MHGRTPSATTWRAAVARGALLLALTLVGGCPPKTAPPGPVPVPVDEVAVTTAIEEHDRRVERIPRLGARGSIDLRWVDEEGDSHFEPGLRLRLGIERPRNTALRLKKLEQDVFLIGSDDEHFWVFDRTQDEVVVSGGRHDAMLTTSVALPLDLRPLALLDLLGLSPLPPPDECTSIEANEETFIVTAPGAGGPMRVYLDRVTFLPRRVDSLDADGAVALTSTTRRYASVRVAGESAADLPRMATLIDVSDVDETVNLKIALDNEMDDEVSPALFDFERLKAYLEPERIEGDLPR